MWIVNFKMKEDEEHILCSQGTELEAAKFIEGYCAAIINHTDAMSKEEVDEVQHMFEIRRMDDVPEEE